MSLQDSVMRRVDVLRQVIFLFCIRVSSQMAVVLVDAFFFCLLLLLSLLHLLPP